MIMCEHYLQLIYRDALMFILVRLYFSQPLKPFFPFKVMVQLILYAEVDVLDIFNSFVWTCHPHNYPEGICPSFLSQTPYIDIPCHFTTPYPLALSGPCHFPGAVDLVE